MSTIRAWLIRLGGTLRRGRKDGELAEELESHVAMHAEENVRAGMTREEARRNALIKLGGLEQTKELYRERREVPWVGETLEDLRFAWRTTAMKPGFATVAILTAALGVGATTAVFSAVDRVLFRSLPYPHDERLVSFGVRAPFEGIEFMLAPEYALLKRQAGPFESMTSLTPGGADCDITEENPVHASCALVEADFLATFGIRPVVGRDFVFEDDRPNAPRVALISYTLWRTRFGGDAKAAGKIISLNGKPVEIVGVLPATFEMPNLVAADFLLPQALDQSALDRNNPRVILRAFARLKPGVSIEQAAAGLQPWFEDSLRFVPPQFRAEVSLRVRSLRDRQIDNSRLGAWVLFGAVMAVLLLACTNVANLLLVRGVARSREMAVRAALGAGRGRLARQALTESLLLAMLGGIVGCGLTYALLRVFVSIAPEGLVRLQQASVDLRVLAFCLAISLGSGVVFGVVPALSKPVPASLAGRTVGAASRGWLRHVLVVGQIAGSLMLVAGAGLLLQSLWKIESVPLGFEAGDLLVAQISLAEHRYPKTTQKLAFFNEAETRLKRTPGIDEVALSDTLPPSGGTQATFFASIEVRGRPRPSQGTGGMVDWRMVTPNYFPVLGIRIDRGRGFMEEERGPNEHPVILSESLAARLFPNENPIGKSMRFTASERQGPWRTIVGVATNVKNNGLTAEADPEFYIPWKDDAETYIGRGSVTLRSSLNAATLVPWVRGEIAAIDPTVPVQFSTMKTRVGKLTDRPRFEAVLLSLFAGIGLLLAALGVYGVVSFFVSQRTQEIGVRVALGATRRDIFRMVLESMARWVIAGAAVGFVGAWLCGRLLQSLLFGIRAHDPLLLSLAVVILLIVALVAAGVPAQRATRVDPLVALRYE